MQYKPQIIYTRINDVFESNTNTNNIVEKNNYKKINNEKHKKQKLKSQNDLQKNKYVNKDLIKSWIKTVQLSKYINISIIFI